MHQRSDGTKLSRQELITFLFDSAAMLQWQLQNLLVDAVVSLPSSSERQQKWADPAEGDRREQPRQGDLGRVGDEAAKKELWEAHELAARRDRELHEMNLAIEDLRNTLAQTRLEVAEARNRAAEADRAACDGSFGTPARKDIASPIAEPGLNENPSRNGASRWGQPHSERKPRVECEPASHAARASGAMTVPRALVSSYGVVGAIVGLSRRLMPTKSRCQRLDVIRRAKQQVAVPRLEDQLRWTSLFAAFSVRASRIEIRCLTDAAQLREHAVELETVSNLGLCRAPEGTTGPPFGDGVITFKGVVHHRASNLEHQVRPAWRPTHLLLGIHPAM
jgi:hypothetical protein